MWKKCCRSQGTKVLLHTRQQIQYVALFRCERSAVGHKEQKYYSTPGSRSSMWHYSDVKEVLQVTRNWSTTPHQAADPVCGIIQMWKKCCWSQGTEVLLHTRQQIQYVALFRCERSAAGHKEQKYYSTPGSRSSMWHYSDVKDVLQVTRNRSTTPHQAADPVCGIIQMWKKCCRSQGTEVLLHTRQQIQYVALFRCERSAVGHKEQKHYSTPGSTSSMWHYSDVKEVLHVTRNRSTTPHQAADPVCGIIQMWKKCCRSQGTEALLHTRQQIQYVTDNIDHNVCTIDLQPSKHQNQPNESRH